MINVPLVLQTSDFTLQTSPPVIVRIVEPKEKTIYDVVYGSLGLAGVMTILAVLAALIFAGVLFWVRSRSETVPLKVDTAATDHEKEPREPREPSEPTVARPSSRS